VATATLTVDWAIVIGVSEVEGSVEVAEEVVVVELAVVNEMVDIGSVVVVSGTGVGGSFGLPLVVVGRGVDTEIEACLGAMRLKAR